MIESASRDLPTSARVVIVGGGIVGCSVAYHLALRGVTDVVLLERKQLTCGTTWHAAGLVGQLRATHNLTRLAQYTTELFATLEAETGQATGFRARGSVSVAPSAERFEELKRGASMARVFGLQVDIIDRDRIAELVPLARVDDLVGGVHLPNDGITNPIDTTQALAKGARARGVRIQEGVRVRRILTEGGRAVGVEYELDGPGDGRVGQIRAEAVVNAAGMWGRELGDQVGAVVPLHAAEHFYIVTEGVQGISPDMPVLRDPDGCGYFKEEAGKLMVGWFEPVAKPWGMSPREGVSGIPESFCFDSLPEDFEHIAPLVAAATHRMPLLANTGIRLFFNGPEAFTPDDRYLLGESPDVPGLFMACGFNSIGIQSSGGAGKVLADWIIDGHPPMDLWDVDVRRVMPFQRNPNYLHDRTVESLGLLYAMHWPFFQPTTARGVRRSALHDRLADRGACFGEVAGWERSNWFAPAGVEPVYQYTYGKQNWFPYSAAEHAAVREAVGLFDQSSFGKFVLEGPDAEAVLNRVCANDVAVPVGRIVYTQWLNDRGGIEADLTITREAVDRYLVVTAAATQVRDFSYLKAAIPPDARAVLTDVTSGYATLSLMGPRSRPLLQSLTPADLSNEAFPFGTSRLIDLGYAIVRASRITYVGELGWELYIPTEFATGVFDVLVAAGEPFGLRHCGYHALNSLRMEKGYRHWGHDVSPDDTPLEAGLGFAIAWHKPGGFIGREALLAQKAAGVPRRLVQFALADGEQLLYHNEPIWRDGVIVGSITSGMYGHTLDASLGMGYVSAPAGGVCDPQFVHAGRYEVEVAGERVPARASLQPWYDPRSARVKA
ncbi:MAG: FAD-dependent oxidoreductase [Actinomycetota bacterium]|nr:FAD-dependent oxidoreductase [Actinomycetota bacterium]